MEQDLVEGDVVRLKTGGPAMTVQKAGPVVRCVWFEKVDQPDKEWEGPITAEFPASALVKSEA
jgi:uncharacterized protein YodC (DUF2158 family)